MLATPILAILFSGQTLNPTPQGPIVNATPTRGEIVLNGIWRFVPATSGQTGPGQDMGLIWVPGDWRKDSGDAPTIVREGTSTAWQTDRNQLGKAWYERTIRIPTEWRGRRVLLDLRRVSTDAEVFLDGSSVGKISWPTGVVDLTAKAKPGVDQQLRLQVIATPEEKEVAVLMGVGQVSTTRADLQWRGIMDDVILLSRPMGGVIDDIFVQTSTRKSEVTLDVELANVQRDGTVNFTAEMLNEKGEVEQTFRTQQVIPAGPKNKVRLTWAWPNPRLWDLAQPNLYTVRLSASGGGITDTALQRFGFREFWVQGRDFYLNGTLFRFRPTLGYDGGVRLRSEREIKTFLARGLNIQEIWPNNDEVRGYAQHWSHHVEVADELGWPLMGPSTHMDPVVSWWSPEKWSDPEARTKWLATFERTMKRFRNSPSILVWANSGNNFGHNDDQAPVRIGQSRKNPIWNNENARWTSHHNRGDQVFAAIRQFDPTRPFMAHQGGAISDIYTANTYLNLLPLQDREEWLSHWAKTADMPYVAVEFGTPFHCTMLRGRKGFGPSIGTEPLVTEYAASLFGAEAYQQEADSYKKAIRDNFIKDQEYR
ncbi:MAG: hypothetical protein MUC92_12235, partial [Fimbriimonadaceae bacterium]|nr:hypothetical protein [Fimbriimonadaceae bacterium]